MTELNSVDNTTQLLKLISRKLSGRVDCKHVMFDLYIDSNTSNNADTLCIHMNPTIYVYRDKHHRKDSDKYLILVYCLNQMHIPIIEMTGSRIVISGRYFIPGHYQYKPSWDNKYRHWFKF